MRVPVSSSAWVEVHLAEPHQADHAVAQVFARESMKITKTTTRTVVANGDRRLLA